MEESELKKAINDVMDERRKSSMTNLEHELHHEWIKAEIRRKRHAWSVAMDAAIKWGVPAGIAAFLWGIWEIFKHKIGAG